MKNLIKKFISALKVILIKLLCLLGEKRYPTSFQAVDIVVIDIQKRKLLLGSKWNKEHTGPIKDKRWCGGFVSPEDSSLEFAAKRELSEEAGKNLEVSRMIYVGSFRVNDSRYMDSPNKVMSAVFVTNYVFGRAEAGDDIAAVYWEDIDSLKIDYKLVLAPDHVELFEMLLTKGII